MFNSKNLSYSNINSVSDLNMASSSRTRKCKNKGDSFCYICGIYTLTRQRQNISLFVKRAYKAYFHVPLDDQEKKWAPHIVCHNCEEMLRKCTKGKRKGLPFGISMVWREPKEHLTDCYFCLVNTRDIGKKPAKYLLSQYSMSNLTCFKF